MRILVLGGTVFLSRAVAEEAARRGLDVTAAARGVSGSVPDGVRHVVLDRDTPDWTDLAGPWDAVLDVARMPSQVRSAVAAIPDAHWIFVSTINVYADDSIAGGTPETLPLREAQHEDVDYRSSPDAYGSMKVACEQLVTENAQSRLVIRPGLIIGPGDPSGRFTYWPERIADVDHPEVLAPGAPDDTVQVIDVRDLAVWIVNAAEQKLTGVFDGTGPQTTRGAMIDAVARGVWVEPRLTWVPQEFLVAKEVEPWSGERSLPVWLPVPEYAGIIDHDVTASLAAGLAVRRLEETARDTLAWLRATPDAVRTGISRADEAAVLEAWHAESA